MGKRFMFFVVTAAFATSLLAGMIFLPPLLGGEQKPKVGEKKKLPWEIVVENYKKVGVRKNGVLLRAEVDLKGHVVLVNWVLDYDGPRQPLSILKPSLDVHASGQCLVGFLAVDKNSEPHELGIHPEVPKLLQPLMEKENFITIRKNEVGKGQIEVPLARVLAQIRAQYPDQFPVLLPSRLFARLILMPVERGEHLNLDAWTGCVETVYVRVPLEKLPKN